MIEKKGRPPADRADPVDMAPNVCYTDFVSASNTTKDTIHYDG